MAKENELQHVLVLLCEREVPIGYAELITIIRHKTEIKYPDIYIRHLISQNYVEEIIFKDGYPTLLRATVNGIEFLKEGGFKKTIPQKFISWIKKDGGWGNLKWVIGFLITFCMGIIAGRLSR